MTVRPTSETRRPSPCGRRRMLYVAVAATIAFSCAIREEGKQSGHAAGAHLPSQPVGSLDGEFLVDGNGAATYSIPIEVPPGTAGVQPSLALTYDSHRDNGYLGMGWALTGISAVTRCGADFRIDGFKGGIDYDADDRFCVDGRRLVAVEGEYGADGTTYHTQLETWTVFTSHGRCGSAPCSFTATNKDGHALSFGGTTGPRGSRIPAQGRTDGSVRTWSLDRLTDLAGNAVTVDYASDAAVGEYFPVSIDYTSNASAGLQPQRSVRFDYGDRPDATRRYIGGAQAQVSKRLTAVTTFLTGGGPDRPILTWSLAYETSPWTGRSRLSSITKCDGAGVCWPPTTFTWSTATGSFEPAVTQLPGPTYVTIDSQSYVYGVLMDIDGDGIADYSRATEFLGGLTPVVDLTVHRGHPDGSFTPAGFSLPGPIYRATSSAVVKVGLLQDVNGDGLLDFTRALRNENSHDEDYGVYLGTGSGFGATPAFRLPDRVYWQVDGRTFESGVLQDIDGDGIPDYSRATVLLATGERLLSIFKGTGHGFVATGTSLPGPLFGLTWTESHEMGILRDVNGDGVADYSAATVNSDRGSSDLMVHLGQSASMTFVEAYSLPDRVLWVANGRVLESGALVDVNGDTIPDYSRATEIPASGERLLDVHVGTGGGAGFLPAQFRLPGPLYFVLDGTSQLQGLLSDWNGDGTTAYSRATEFADGTAVLALHRSTVDGFVPTGTSLPGPIFKALPEGTHDRAIYEDVNGDGEADFVDASCMLEPDGRLSNCSLGVRLAAGPVSDLLLSVATGFGGVTSVDYAPITSDVYERSNDTAYPVREVQGPLLVVGRLSRSDGRGATYSYGYRYAGAHVDALGYGWLGFHRVTMTETSSGRMSRMTFGDAFPFYGLVTSSQALDARGVILAETTSRYEDIAPAESRASVIHEPVKTSSTFTMFEAGAPVYSLEQRFEYDAYANVTIFADLGDVADADDDVYTCTRYSNDAAKGRYGYALQRKVERTLQACESFVDQPDPARITWDPSVDLRWTRTTYDEAMSVASESTFDDSHGAFLTDSYARDAVGNVVSATNPAGATTTFAYDESYQTFLRTTRSPALRRGAETYELVTSTTFDPGFGTLTSTTDANGVTTSQRLDGFGRPVQALGPDDVGEPTVLVETTWGSSDGAFRLETRQRPDWRTDDRSAWYWDRQYVDGMDRTYRQERSGVKDGQPATIAMDTSFDQEGRLSSETVPHYLGDPAPATVTTYDEYNRPLRVTDPAGVITKMDYADGGRRVTVTNAFATADAQTRISHLTARGWVRQSTGPNGLTTSYAYSKLGQILGTTTTPEPRFATVVYDSLGRTRSLTTSDTGTAAWTFDAAGRLAESSDAAGNTIRYADRDPLGRVHVRTMSSGGLTTSASLGYDDPAVANGLGNVTSVELDTGDLGTWKYAYAYTGYGQVKAGRTIVGADEYAYASSYDPLGRVVEATHPDGSVASMSYLTSHNLGNVAYRARGAASARSYLTCSSYTALDQVQAVRHDVTGVAIENTYHPPGPSFGQLATIRVLAGGSSPTSHYSRAFTWNALYALTSSADLLNPAASETYAYDTQSINASAGFLTGAKGAYGSLAYEYDRLGNMTRGPAGSIDYPPDVSQPSSTQAGATFAYLANGNLSTQVVAGKTWSYEFDAAGQLVRIDRTEGGATKTGRAAYDLDGRRIFLQRVGESLKTYSITPFFEVVDLGGGAFQHTAYVPGVTGPCAAVTADGKGNVPTSRSEGARGALFGDRTASSGLRAAWHSTAALALRATEAAPRALGAAIPWIGLACVAACLRGVIRRSRRARGTEWSRGRPAFAAVVPVVIWCLLLASADRVEAALQPGAHGAGIPTAGVAFFVSNQVESTVLVTDATGAVTASIGYFPYGGIDEVNSSGTDDFRAKFGGHEWDPSSRLYDMGARHYMPELGRYLQSDPAGQYASPYLYAHANPTSMVDANGEFAILIAIVIGAALGAYFGAAAVNHDMNPLAWNWKSGKTYAGLVVGALIGAVGAAAGGVAVEAGVAIGASGGLAAEAAGVAVGIAGQALVGAGENAAFTALGGGSAKDVAQSAGEGALWGAALGAAGEALGGMAAQASRRLGSAAEEGEGELGAARRASDEEEGCDCGCATSFLAGTSVHGADGRLRSIESIRPGDEVLTSTLADGTDGRGTVSRVRDRMAMDFVDVRLSTGTTITTTPEHRFRAHERGWIEAKDLGPGMQLDGLDHRPVGVVSVGARRATVPARVLSIDVEGSLNYRVSSDGVLVHNGKTKFCRAKYDPVTKTVTREWNESELQKRYPSKKDYQAIQRDIRFKMRRSNQLIKSGTVKAFTRVKNPVKTASREWVRWRWQQKYGSTAGLPSDVRTALARLRTHFASQDVDESVERIMGGLTWRDGAPEAQTPLNSFVNQTAGAAIGGMSRSVPPGQPVNYIRDMFVPKF